MRTSTFLRYLISDRGAILTIASGRGAVALGFLFVLSAAFAREYDGEDLLHEPWHLFLPLGASLLSSFLLFSLAYGLGRWKGSLGHPFFSAYRSFLGLFWMTAPLAWLYAIPYERFLTPVGAMRANLGTLGLVSLWRVALMVRVLTVVLNYQVVAAVCVVMAFADGLALTLLTFLPFPLIDVMGGIRLSESDAVLRSTATSVCMLGSCSLPFWLVGVVMAALASKPSWQVAPHASGTEASRPSTGLRILAWSSVAIWGVLLPFTQPEQQLRYRVEHDFEEGRIDTALAEMSAHRRSDFPPHWSPPPRYVSTVLGNNMTTFLQICEAIDKERTAPWVQAIYLNKLQDVLLSGGEIREEYLPTIGALLRRLPEATVLVEELEREDPHAMDALKPYLGDPKAEKMGKSKALEGKVRP